MDFVNGSIVINHHGGLMHIKQWPELVVVLWPKDGFCPNFGHCKIYTLAL